MSCDHTVSGEPWWLKHKAWEPCPQCGLYKPVTTSETDKARGCERAWAYRYGSRTPKPPKAEGAKIGDGLHTVQEDYLKHGKVPTPEGVGELARRGLSFLPPPGTSVVEGWLHRTIDGIPFWGKQDFVCRVGHLPTQTTPESFLKLGLEHPVTGDHKTSKAPSKYGKWSNAKRLDDPQHLIYGWDQCETFNTGEAAQRWLYYPTQTRGRVKPSDSVLTRKELRGGLERVVLPVAQKIWTWRDREHDPASFKANPGFCDAFGGCDYGPTKLNICPVTAVDHAAHVFKQGASMSETGASMSETPDIWKRMEDLKKAQGGDGVNGASQAPSQAPVTQGGEQPTFSFSSPAGGQETAPAPQTPPPVEQPAQPPPVQTTPTPTPSGDPLVRIGHALIAAGRSLIGG